MPTANVICPIVILLEKLGTGGHLLPVQFDNLLYKFNLLNVETTVSVKLMTKPQIIIRVLPGIHFFYFLQLHYFNIADLKFKKT